MKISCLIFLSIVFVPLSFAQNVETPKASSTPIISIFTLDDGCGDPSTYSQTWDWREGTIIEVVDAKTIVFKQDIENGNKKDRVLTVELVGIDTSINAIAIKKYLTKFLNKSVTIWANLKAPEDLTMFAVVTIARGSIEINESLMEQGIARFKTFDLGHLIPYNKACQLEKAEAKAKKAKLGIWSKN